MIIRVSIDLNQEIGSLPQKELVDLARLLCDRIDTEGIIEQVRAVVNDPKYDDQKPPNERGDRP